MISFHDYTWYNKALQSILICEPIVIRILMATILNLIYDTLCFFFRRFSHTRWIAFWKMNMHCLTGSIACGAQRTEEKPIYLLLAANMCAKCQPSKSPIWPKPTRSSQLDPKLEPHGILILPWPAIVIGWIHTICRTPGTPFCFHRKLQSCLLANLLPHARKAFRVVVEEGIQAAVILAFFGWLV